MFKNEQLAAEINALMLEYGARLDASLHPVKDKGSPEEFFRYRRAVGKILGEMLTEVMNPIYESHPTLMPEAMKL